MARRRHTSYEEEEAEINLTPMLDVVFIMLIFFIVTTSFVKEAGVSVNEPGAHTATHRQQNNVVIAITPGGQVWIGGHPVDVRSVRAEVERLHARNPGGGVLIQADQASHTGLLVKVMDQVRQAGIHNMAIAARKQ